MISQHTIQQFNKGNETVFREIFDRYYFTFWAYLEDRFGNTLLTTEREEIISDAFIKVWKIREKFKSMDAIRLYLNKAVKTRAINACESTKTRRTNQDKYLFIQNESETEEDAIFPEVAEILSCLDNAKEARKIIAMTLEGLKPREIAHKTGLSIQTVKNQKTRALGILRKRFAAP